MTTNTVTGEILQRYVLDNVWCSPEQDLQVRYMPAKISPVNGHWGYFIHMWNKVTLPTAEDRYHIYQIGAINPELIGLNPERNKWHKVTDVMGERLVIIDIYIGRGLQIPRCLVHYRYTSEGNLIFAIRRPARTITGWDWEEDKVYMRFYSNAYFDSLRSKNEQQYVHCISRQIGNREDVSSFLQEVNNMPMSVGIKYFFVDGRYTPELVLATIDNGSYVDCVYDSSIKRVIDFNISELQEFSSKLDNVRKYLLHHTAAANTIDYQDDIDCFVYGEVGSNKVRGMYVHKNDIRTMRNVTHRDYSLSLPAVDGIISASQDLAVVSDCFIRLHIRHSGFERPLIMEKNRIHELYRLGEDRIVKAMLGIDSTIPEWRADNLEISAYAETMGTEYLNITRESATDLLGYHSISRLLGDTPAKTQPFSGRTIAAVPVGLRDNCTCYEYDSSGALLGWYYHADGSTYVCKNSNASVVEMLYGKASEELDIIQDTVSGELDPTASYRFYVSSIVANQRLNDWTPANNGLYVVQNNVFTWVYSDNRSTRIISNKRHLFYEFNYEATDGVLQFNIVHKFNGGHVRLDMPLGELDVWLNRRKLIENIDFIVNFPILTIINKEHLLNGGVGEQNIAVRFKGFCNDDMTHRVLDEVGFVTHGTMSYNDRYNLRADHVIVANVGGAILHASDLHFAEDGIRTQGGLVRNGTPYSLRNVVVPIPPYITGRSVDEDVTYEMLATAKEVDGRIEDYMTLYRPQETSELPNIINARWKLHSPFFTKIISDLRDGILWDEKFTQHYGSEYVEQVIQPYKYLLNADLSREDGLFDPRYVIIHPHPFGNYVMLDAYQHKFLRFVYTQYGRRVADIADFVGIRPFDF